MPGLTLRQVDRKTGVPGIGAALVGIGWLEEIDGGVTLKHFNEHNGDSAKKRLETARRVAKHRAQNADVTPEALPSEHKTDTSALAREEKRREEENPIPSLLTQAPALPAEERPAAQLALVDSPPSKPKSAPDCPHLAVLALWAEVLPSLPQHLPSQWRGSRADHLRARWRETAIEKGWAVESDGIEYLRRLFAYVGQSAFLTGRATQRDQGRRPFVVELEWLVNPTNWAKVHEGKYHTEAA